ncbi:hypothetical protein [Streptomyces sp. G-G2]|uniref:hypothetical protein n=1 Tax=Streptomyces sp. G-G2 TaxID=3046201 RepID=UPI0024B8795E|nr:hypothetical protein [Streptomyces sp. G-G2]MDJ0381170.1 hypothetical protein [Streptomyces sp. G-G2]
MNAGAAGAAGQRCHRCELIIKSGGHKNIRHSAPDSHPPIWEHDIRDPSCRPAREPAS